MMRSAVLAALALATMLSARAAAQPGFPGTFQVVDAKVEKDKLTWTDTKYVPEAREEAVEVVVNGMKVVQKRVVVVTVPVAEVRSVDLKGLKATDGAGKAVTADKLSELLKESTAVVLVSGAVPEKHRKLFKDTTLFLQLPPENLVPVPLPSVDKKPEAVPPPKM
jgi:hypothetical protein